ncbi:MAG: alpha/beta hydrolase, partial [Gammaproteobacteria bacterium]|nr:alpha/beta hydrolase [Gammaproteobacteria bacterium]
MEKVYFVTNRKPNKKDKPTNFGKDFSDDGVANLRYGYAEVSGKKLSDIKIVVAAEKLDLDEKRQSVAATSVLGSTDIMARVRKEMMDNGRDTLIYIHGYNVTFKEALSAAAKLAANLKGHEGGNGINVVLFSWPSDGSAMPFLAYASDRQDAAPSGPAFARAFMKLADFLRGASSEEECDQKLHLLAHSMGNYVLRHAVQEIRSNYPGRPPRVFDQIFMMAADEDDDTFEHDYKLAILPRLGRRVNVYFNHGDIALQISDKTKGNPDRLGTDGPRLPQQVPAKVSQIDCTPVVSGPVEHSYYLDSMRVVVDMLEALAGIPSDQI